MTSSAIPMANLVAVKVDQKGYSLVNAVRLPDTDLTVVALEGFYIVSGIVSPFNGGSFKDRKCQI